MKEVLDLMKHSVEKDMEEVWKEMQRTTELLKVSREQIFDLKNQHVKNTNKLLNVSTHLFNILKTLEQELPEEEEGEQ